MHALGARWRSGGERGHRPRADSQRLRPPRLAARGSSEPGQGTRTALELCPGRAPSNKITTADSIVGEYWQLIGSGNRYEHVIHAAQTTYYAEKPIARGVEAGRSIDLGFKKPVFDEGAEFLVSVTDHFNDFGIRQEIQGDGFDAVYENFHETQTVTVGELPLLTRAPQPEGGG